jgi:hypothetical protein
MFLAESQPRIGAKAMTDKKSFADEVRDHATDDAPFGLHNLGTDLPHTAFTGTGRWLQMDKPGEFSRILDEFLARVRAAGALRSREPG